MSSEMLRVPLRAAQRKISAELLRQLGSGREPGSQLDRATRDNVNVIYIVTA